MQVRLATPITSEDYISGKLWRCATLVGCPWHPEGGCGFARHGTYQRIKPAHTRVARWYCRKARRTVSALPDCLASHRSGTLLECEATVCAVETSPSMAAACQHLRTDIELPGALRYLRRLVRDVHRALQTLKGLFPQRLPCEPTLSAFTALAPLIDSPESPCVLMRLRDLASRYLPQLPTPLGFNPHPIRAPGSSSSFQQRMGHDPPVAFINPSM